MSERQVLFECAVGSRLYGTNLPTSDDDFAGVFLHSLDDLFDMDQPCEEWNLSIKHSKGEKNEKGDIDRKFFSIKRFFQLASQGQPGQLEFFFVPKEKVVTSSPIWEEIVANKNLFLGKTTIKPFVGFATAQARKSLKKGDNLKTLQNVVPYLEAAVAKSSTVKMPQLFERYSYDPEKGEGTAFAFFMEFPLYRNEQGCVLINVGGTQHDVNTAAKVILGRVEKAIETYGERSHVASKKGYDPKSLLHAWRLLYEANEFLETGHITLPRPPDELKILMDFRHRVLPFEEVQDSFLRIEEEITKLKEVEARSSLPDEPDYKGVRELCKWVYRKLVEPGVYIGMGEYRTALEMPIPFGRTA